MIAVFSLVHIEALLPLSIMWLESYGGMSLLLANHLDTVTTLNLDFQFGNKNGS